MKSYLKPDENSLDEALFLEPSFDADELASDNPDLLFITDGTLYSDFRLFPSVPFGVPSNIVSWGGWGIHSENFDHALTNFDIDPYTADGRIFLRDDIRLLRGTLDPAPHALMQYIQSYCEEGETVDYLIDNEWGGVYSFQFYTY